MKVARIAYALAELLKDVKAHPKVGEEIVDLILKTGHEKEFLKILDKRLENIRTLGRDVVKLKHFEKLKEYPDLYSMHINSSHFNIRILYTYLWNGEILLHCFYEREGKLNTSYDAHAPIAKSRKEELEG